MVFMIVCCVVCVCAYIIPIKLSLMNTYLTIFGVGGGQNDANEA